jgi:hypothetical protein
MNKCHNCNNGIVDGGSTKRIKKEFDELEINKFSEISNVKEKDKDKRENIISKIKEKYDPLIDVKSREVPLRKSKCCACGGVGLR